MSDERVKQLELGIRKIRTQIRRELETNYYPRGEDDDFLETLDVLLYQVLVPQKPKEVKDVRP